MTPPPHVCVCVCVCVSYIGKTDSITISVWNHKKIHKRQGAGFLGCIRLLSNAISRLKDTGCNYTLLLLHLLLHPLLLHPVTTPSYCYTSYCYTCYYTCCSTLCCSTL